MKVREFTLEDAPLDPHKLYQEIWIYGANHGYAEACKDHQEILNALEKAVKELNGLPKSLGYEFTHVPEMEALLIKYKGE